MSALKARASLPAQFEKIHGVMRSVITLATNDPQTIDFMQKVGAAFLKLLPIALVIMAGFAWAEDGKPLSADELEALIKGGTRAGKITAGTYYITFQVDGNYCVRVNLKQAQRIMDSLAK